MKYYIPLLAFCVFTLSLNQVSAAELGDECGSEEHSKGLKNIKGVQESNFSSNAMHAIDETQLNNKTLTVQKGDTNSITKYNTFNHNKDDYSVIDNNRRNEFSTITFKKSESDEKWYVNENVRITCTLPVNTGSYIRLENRSKALLKIYSDSPLVFIMGINGIKQISSISMRNEERGSGSAIEIEPDGTIELGLVLDFGPTSFDSFVNVSDKHPTLPIVIVPKGTPDLTKELSETAKSLSFPSLVTSVPTKINASLQFNKVEINKNGSLKNNTRLINKKPVAVPVSFNRPVFILKRSKLSIKEYMTSRVYFAPGEEVNVITDERGVKYSAYKND